ncbi:hypothetical protein GCM10009718_33040 [Isoptericola halotolerans]
MRAVGPRSARASVGPDVARGTTLRNVRVSDEVWTAAREQAEKNGETVSDVVRRALVEYVTTSPPQESER